MAQYVAIRPGDGRAFVIPSSWCHSYRLLGWRINPAPAGLEEVTRPTVLEHVKRFRQTPKSFRQTSEVPPERGEGEAASQSHHSPVVEAASPAPSQEPPKRKRKRRKREG